MSGLIDTANLDLASTPGVAPPQPAPPPPPPSAIPTAQRARILNGVHTDVTVQLFADCTLILVTQAGRIGCMIQVSPPPPTLPTALPPPPSLLPTSASSDAAAFLASLPPPHPSTALTPLFGVAPTPHVGSLHDLYASQVGAIVFHQLGGAGGGPDGMDAGGGAGVKPVVLGIGLKLPPPLAEGDEDGGVTEEERQTFAEVMEMVLECLG
ncbi:hypothetical protein JCM8097_005049 [Rhodosporidiobolus ruineniae]